MTIASFRPISAASVGRNWRGDSFIKSLAIASSIQLERRVVRGDLHDWLCVRMHNHVFEALAINLQVVGEAMKPEQDGCMFLNDCRFTQPMKSGSYLSCLHASFLSRPASSGLTQIGGNLRGLDDGPEGRGDIVDLKNRRLPVAAQRLFRRSSF